MKRLFKRTFVSFYVLSMVLWSSGVLAVVDEPGNTEDKMVNEKVTVCHMTGADFGEKFVEIEIANEAVDAHLGNHSGDYVGKCVLPPPPVEIVHGEWCSALYGVMSSTSLLDNNVVDVNDDGARRNLTDTEMMSTWYDEGNNTACRESFGPEGEFTEDNYLQIDWCAGLFQGIKDSVGSQRGEAKFSEIFDVSNDGVINLTDVALLATYIGANDQATCYTHYGFPAWPEEPALHGEWCSALYGVMSSTSLLDNNVVDVNDDGIIRDLTDTGIMSTWYDEGNNTACRESFGPEGEFIEDNYLQIDWCSGLVQGLRDHMGTKRGDANFSEIFDVNNDGVINLTDVVLVATYVGANDQATCYTHYGFPAWPDDAMCGNGLVEEGEECDGGEPVACTTDGGYTGTKTCNMPVSDSLRLQSIEGPLYCVFNPCFSNEYCGDEIVNGNEQCDDGEEGSEACTANCTFTDNPEPTCGNGAVEGNEVCDDGNMNTEMCGDGVLNSGTFCNASCSAVLNLSEACDAGTGGSSSCTAQCTIIQNPPQPTPSGGGGGGGGGIVPINIFNIQTSVATSSASISWETSRQSITWMLYGLNSSYGDEYQGAAYYSTHKAALSGLTPGTTYHYQIRAKDSSNNAVYDIDRTFTTLGAGSLPPQVLGVKEEACKPDVDGDIKDVMKFVSGSLIRGCGPEVYHVLGNNLFHIPNWQYLHDNYFAQRIYNVTDEVIAQYGQTKIDDTSVSGKSLQVKGIKFYADGTLLKGSDNKIYVIINGKKVHIVSLEELKKYMGRKIIKVSDEVLNQY